MQKFILTITEDTGSEHILMQTDNLDSARKQANELSGKEYAIYSTNLVVHGYLPPKKQDNYGGL